MPHKPFIQTGHVEGQPSLPARLARQREEKEALILAQERLYIGTPGGECWRKWSV